MVNNGRKNHVIIVSWRNSQNIPIFENRHNNVVIMSYVVCMTSWPVVRSIYDVLKTSVCYQERSPHKPSIQLSYKLVKHMNSFIAKRVISILVNLRYLRFKLLKYKENNKKICNTFDHNFKNIPLYIMSNVSLERYYFVLYDGALTLKMSKMALNACCDKTLHIKFRVITCLQTDCTPLCLNL